jgi:hypothetical protein
MDEKPFSLFLCRFGLIRLKGHHVEFGSIGDPPMRLLKEVKSKLQERNQYIVLLDTSRIVLLNG